MGFPTAIVQHIPAPPSPLTASGSDFISDNGEIKVTITKDAITGANVVRFARSTVPSEVGVQWYPKALKYISADGIQDVIYSADNTSPVVVNRNVHARYTGHFTNVDDRFIVEAGQLKHFITLNSEQRAPLSFIKKPQHMAVGGVLTFDPSYTIRMSGMTMVGKFTAPAGLDIVDADGKTMFTLPPVQAWDQNGNTVQGEYVVNVLSPGRLDVSMAIDYSWLAQDSIVYPVIIDPTVVIAGSYQTMGNGRQFVKMANGWLVTGTLNNSTIYYHVSKDGGTTFTDLCHYSTSSQPYTFIDMIAVGNKIFTLYTNTYSAGVVQVIYFDATTITAGSQVTTVSNPCVGIAMTGMFEGGSIAWDGTKFYAVWAGKTSQNAGTTMVWNTSTDGIAWGNAVQLGTPNANFKYSYPKFAMNPNSANHVLMIIQDDTGTPARSLQPWKWTGSSFNVGNNIYTNSGTHTQFSPDMLFDPNGNLYCTWHGQFGAATTNTIQFLKSTDGGTTWSAATQPNGIYVGVFPSLEIDPGASKVRIFFQGRGASDSYDQIREATSTDVGTTWTLANHTTNTANGVMPPKVIAQVKTDANLTDAIRWIWGTTTPASEVLYDYFSLNSPPNAPTLTAHANFDATTSQTFTATFSDPDSGNTMSARQLQVVDVVAGTTVYDTGKVGQTTTVGNQNFDVVVPANTLTNGKQYQWREQTWDNSGAQGPYSTYSTFYTAAAPTVIITTPTANQVVTSSSLTVGISYSDPANNPQQSYEAMLYDATGVTLIEDSGVIQGTNNQYTLQTVLANNTTYQVKVSATNSQGLTSATVSQTFSTSFTPPVPATTAATPQNANARIQVSIVNPSGGSAVASNNIYRRLTGTTAWTRIATGLAVGSVGTPTLFNDYAVASSQGYDYKVTAVGNNGTSIDSTVITNVTAGMLRGTWIHDVSNPSGSILNLKYIMNTAGDGTTPNSGNWTPEATTMQFAGRPDPTVEFGESESVTLTKGKITMFDKDGTWPLLKALIKSKPTVCIRDGRGRKVFGVVLGYASTDMLGGTQVDIILTQTSYTEAV